MARLGSITGLPSILRVEDTRVNRAMGSKWMIAAIARILSPGCKVDSALYLEGPQGLGKSSALKALAGTWFTDQLPDVGRKTHTYNFKASG